MPEPYSLSELKEMFITQKIFREDITKVNDRIIDANAETILHMDIGFKAITDEMKPICKIQDDHETRLKVLEKDPEKDPESESAIQGGWRNSVWLKRGLFLGGLFIALISGFGLSFTGVGP